MTDGLRCCASCEYSRLVTLLGGGTMNDQLVRADARCESIETDGPRFAGISTRARVTLAGDDVSVDVTLAAELARKVSIDDAFDVVVIRKVEANG